HPISCRAIGVIGTKCPEPKATEVERDPDGSEDRGHVELGPQNDRCHDGGEKGQTLQGRSRVPVAEARDDGEPGGAAGAERPIPGKALRAIDNLALERLDAKLGAAMWTEGGLGRHRAPTARARLHAVSVLALPTVAASERSSVPVTIRLLNGVAHVTLDRPPLNVLDIDTVRGFPEIKLAAFPPVAAAWLPERCAWPLAMRLLLGESIDARAAEDAGLVSQVVEKARLAQTADGVATELAAHSAVALGGLT